MNKLLIGLGVAAVAVVIYRKVKAQPGPVPVPLRDGTNGTGIASGTNSFDYTKFGYNPDFKLPDPPSTIQPVTEVIDPYTVPTPRHPQPELITPAIRATEPAPSVIQPAIVTPAIRISEPVYTAPAIQPVYNPITAPIRTVVNPEPIYVAPVAPITLAPVPAPAPVYVAPIRGGSSAPVYSAPVLYEVQQTSSEAIQGLGRVLR